MEVLLNKVRFTVDTAAFDARYQVVAVRTGKKYISTSEILLDPGACLSREEAAQIRACLFSYDENSRVIYFLLPRDGAAESVVRKLVAVKGATDDGEWTVEAVQGRDVGERALGQLLLNAIPHFGKHRELAVSNISGKLFVVQGTSGPTAKNPGKASQVVCLEIALNRDMLLQASVRTFTSLHDLCSPRHRRHVFNNYKHPRSASSYPQYRLGGMKNTLLRVPDAERIDTELPHEQLPAEARRTYIQRQFDFKKSGVDFLAMGSETAFEKSKLVLVSDIVDEFNARYADILETPLHFATGDVDYDNAVEVRANTARATALRKACRDMVGGRTINVVIGDEAEHVVARAEAIARMYRMPFGADSTPEKDRVRLCDRAVVSREVDREALNIIVVQSRKYYRLNKMPDPYAISRDVPVQHITTEHACFEGLLPELAEQKFPECRNILFTSIVDLLIKTAIVENSIGEFCRKRDGRESFFDLALARGMSFVWAKWVKTAKAKEIEQDLKERSRRGEEITFAQKKKVVKKPLLFSFDVHDDCATSIRQIQPADGPQARDLFTCFESHDSAEAGLEYIIVAPDGTFNLVCRTPLRIFCDVHRLRELREDIRARKEQQVDDGNGERVKGWKGAGPLRDYMTGMTDIHHLAFEGQTFYLSGEIGRGIKKGFTRAPSVRRVLVHPEDVLAPGPNVFMQKPGLFRMMTVPFIRSNGIGVMPFPVKLLREWALLHSDEVREAVVEEREEMVAAAMQEVEK